MSRFMIYLFNNEEMLINIELSTNYFTTGSIFTQSV